MMNRTKFVMGSFLLLFLVASCEQTQLGLFARSPGENPPEVVEEGPDTGGSNVLNRWTQPEATIRPVDIFFVTDTSQSMDDERVAVANALSSFLGTFETRGIDDYCVGILRGVAGTYEGALYSKDFETADMCLCKYGANSLTDAQIQAKFLTSFGDNEMPDTDIGASCTLVDPEVCPDGSTDHDCKCTDGGEAGLYAFHKSFIGSLDKGTNEEEDIYQGNRDLGCYRNNAAVAAIFVTDENDLSTSFYQTEGCSAEIQTLADMGITSFTPPGPASEIDWQCREMGARLDYYSDANGNLTRTPDVILSDMYQSQGQSPFVSAVVGYVDPAFDGEDENEYPYGYAELVEDSGGDLVDITLTNNQSAFNQAFSELGTKLSQQTTTTTFFTLSSPACPDTLTVTVDGSNVDSFVTIFDDNLHFTITPNAAGDEGAVVEAHFEICD